MSINVLKFKSIPSISNNKKFSHNGSMSKTMDLRTKIGRHSKRNKIQNQNPMYLTGLKTNYKKGLIKTSIIAVQKR